MLFKQVAGNNSIKEALIQQVQNNRVSHAQLFFGPDGSGCLPMAIAFAQYVSCTQKQAHDSCGTCSSCIKFEKLVHPDFHMVFPVNTTSQVKKDPGCDDFEHRIWCDFGDYFRHGIPPGFTKSGQYREWQNI